MTADATPVHRSPLGATTADTIRLARADGVEVRERPFLAQILLRVDPTPGAIEAVGRRTGIQLPTTPNRLVQAPRSGHLTIWMGPDEWLVIGQSEPMDLEALLVAATIDHGGTVVDVSAHRTLLELAGPRVRDLLAAGTSVDLHPRVFDIGAAAQTTLARVDVIIGRGAIDTYHVAVRASFAQYLVAWLKDAMGAIEGGAS